MSTFDEGSRRSPTRANSFANSTIVAPDAATSVASDSAAWTPVRVRFPMSRRSEHAAGQGLERQRAYPGPATTRSLTGRALRPLRRSPAQPAGTCLLRRRDTPGRRARPPERRRRREAHRSRTTRPCDRHRTFGDRRGYSAGAFVARSPTHRRRDRSEPERRLRGHGVIHRW